MRRFEQAHEEKQIARIALCAAVAKTEWEPLKCVHIRLYTYVRMSVGHTCVCTNLEVGLLEMCNQWHELMT